MNHRMSIIIPILNEAEHIGKLINELLLHSKAEHVLEIIVVDGGSQDGSQAIVQQLSSENRNTQIKLITSEKGRAKQLNNGASEASGSILYFLHADSFPPQNFDALIISEVKKGNLAGCFRMRFDSDHWWLRLVSWLTQFSWRACRGGDQSQFITRKLFEDIGGYDESYLIYEDNILINALYARKQYTVINKTLTTSARLYHEQGVWNVQYRFLRIYIKRWFGASADELCSYYKKHLC